MPYRTLNPPPHWLDLRQVEQEADRLIAGRNVRLRFAAALEDLFNEERAPRRRQQLARMGLLALLVYDMFLVGDYLALPGHLLRAVVLRLGVVTPLVLVSLLLMRLRGMRVALQEWVACVLCMAGFGAILALHHGVGSAVSVQIEPDLLLVLLAMTIVLRPDFLATTVTTCLCCTVYLADMVLDTTLSVNQQFSAAGQVFWFAVMALLANRALWRETRFSWLLEMRGRIQRQMLAAANEELLNQSLHDQLTGVPNRAAYDRRLPELWQHAIANKDTIAAVMVDVDYFKQVNDNFGHLYGDRVLQRIANLLEQAMRAELDFVARYGGEEFVVLLPGSTLESGMHVAERIRKLVEVAGSPAVSRGETPLPDDVKWSTVSCGVAAIAPTEKDDARALIDAADAALYRAKQSGRNRVCTMGTPTLARSA